MNIKHLNIAVVCNGRRELNAAMFDIIEAENSKGAIVQKYIKGQELRVMYPELIVIFKAILVGDYRNVHGMHYDGVLYETGSFYAREFALEVVECCTLKSKIAEAFHLMEISQYLRSKHIYRCVKGD